MDDEARRALEAETQKTRAERAGGIVAGLGEPLALAVAGWLSVEADAIERAGVDPVVVRELARAIQDATAACADLDPLAILDGPDAP